MKKSYQGILAAIWLLLATGQQAHADVILSLGAQDIPVFPPQSYIAQAPVELQGTVSDGGASAYGYANLSTGTLRTYAQSSTNGGSTGGSSLLADSFTFSGPTGGTAYLDWLFSGKLFNNSFHPFLQQSGGELYFFLIAPDPSPQGGWSGVVQQEHYYLVNIACYAMMVATTCVEGDTIFLQGSLPIPVWTDSNAPGYSLQVQLTAWANLGDIADFSNSAHLSLRLPDGVTMRSSSGVFLDSTNSGAAIPEPGSLALLGISLAGLAVRRRSENSATAA